METLSLLFSGLIIASSPTNLLFCLIGTSAGVIVGALPGLGPSAGLAILLPITFGMDPVGGIIMLAGIYYGAMYGGAIASILIGVPGDSAAVMTVVDGYPLSKQGRAGAAIGMASCASFIGGTSCVIVFTFLAPALAQFALSFGPPEYFALMVLGLTAVAGLADKSPLKAFLATLIGLMLSIVGLDLVIGLPRYTFGMLELFSGVDFIVVALGMYGITEIMTSMEEKQEKITFNKGDLARRKLFPTVKDWAVAKWHIVRSTALGFFVGMLPGAGATIATFLAYGMAKSTAPQERKEVFGKGAIEGVAAPESSNNAASVGAFVPMITLGVPGSASTAIMMGALLMFGLKPGPMLFENNPNFVWGLIGSMYIGNIMIILLVMLCLPFFVRVLQIPSPILNSVVMAFILVGAYSVNNSMFNVWLTIIFGLLGFIMKKLNFPAAPLVLALILGNMMETSLRQSLILSNGSPVIFFTKPIACVILICAIGTIIWPIISNYRKSKKSAAN